ncbi:AEC family transporter [Pseudodonghicola flavimaris]|uniref:AEC family transporter n=1 Tax=Pseudodonghicola flavimaris TaxID=3050036 RepID=A0ABT7EX33_9RHOB|nr:AEC family transporter [Pseudodonghicola flavimaris]MDK3016903.1 AEC family transporter [Pseudodonghicola flavimaris]
MNDIISITAPIYAAVLIGYLVVRLGWFRPEDMRMMGQYVLNLALPALLFTALATRPLSAVLRTDYLLVMLAGGLATMALSFGWFSLTAPDKLRRALAVLGSACPNSGFIGYPVMLLLFPDLAGVILALNVLIENVVVIPIGLVLMDLASGQAGLSPLRLLARVLRTLLRRPMVIGMIAGLAVSALGWELPAPVLRLTGMFGTSAAALSLVVIGGSLVGLPMKGNKLLAGQIATVKLLLHPAMVALAAALLPALGLAALSPDMYAAAVLSAAIPMFSIYPILAQERGLGGAAAIALLLATSGAFVTLNILLAWLT